MSNGLKASVVLLSGGIDSTVSAMAKSIEPDTLVYLLTISYQQGAMDSEINHAYRVADWFLENCQNVVEHFELFLDSNVRAVKEMAHIVGKDSIKLTAVDPSGFVGWRRPGSSSGKAGYPSTRDEVFALMAAAGAEARLRDLPFLTQADVVLSTNKDDLHNYTDIEIENYTVHLSSVLAKKQLPSEGKMLMIDLPLIGMSKKEVVGYGLEIGAPLHLTWSCYFGEEDIPCAVCDQCRWRADAFRSIGVDDPAQI